MKRAKIIDVFSPDIEDLYSYEPDDPKSFCIFLQISVGTADNRDDQQSGETFDIEVFTPEWLLAKYKKDDIFFPTHSLIVFNYNFELILQALKKSIESCYGDSWEEIVEKIGKIAAWEFKDYQSEH